MLASELTAYSHFIGQQQALEDRYTRRSQMDIANQAAALKAYDRSTQLIEFPDGGTRNSRPVNNSSQSIGGILPLVTITPSGAFVSSR